MNLTSTAFENNAYLPSLYTCDGEGISPPLTIGDVPPATKSLAIIMDDPDAPMGTFAHWLLWNISPTTTNIEEKSVPSGAIEGTNTAGKRGYFGACPPSGTHHYQFIVYALDTIFDLPSSTEKFALELAMKDHVITQAQLTSLYQRPTR